MRSFNQENSPWKGWANFPEGDDPSGNLVRKREMVKEDGGELTIEEFFVWKEDALHEKGKGALFVLLLSNSMEVDETVTHTYVVSWFGWAMSYSNISLPAILLGGFVARHPAVSLSLVLYCNSISKCN